MFRILMSWVVVGFTAATAEAEIPLQVNHQGQVRVSGAAFNGNGDFRFAFVDPDTGNNLWTNDGTQVPGPGTPAAAVNLPVINGIYNVRLGDTTVPNMTAVSSLVFNDDNVVLRIWFDDTQGSGTEQLAPDHVLTTAPYAFRVYDGVTLSEDQIITGDKSFTGTASFDRVASLQQAPQVGGVYIQDGSNVTTLSGGEAGQVLASQGVGVSPAWKDPATVVSTPTFEVMEDSASNVVLGTTYADTGISLTIQASSAADVFLVLFSGMGHVEGAGALGGLYTVLKVDAEFQWMTERGATAYYDSSLAMQMRYSPGDVTSHTITVFAKHDHYATSLRNATLTVLKISQ